MTPIIDEIIKSRRKTISLILTRDGRLVIRAPLRTTDAHIAELVKKKQTWIEKKKRQHQERQQAVGQIQFTPGGTIPYLGRLLTVRPTETLHVKMAEGTLWLPDRYHSRSKAILQHWLKGEARSIITNRVLFWSKRTGLEFSRIRITNATGRWGSCGPTNSLQFSWRLVMAPLAVLDYVVVHELVHTSVKNHSKKFWQRVGTILPEYKQHNLWLREHDYLMGI
jgi:predicted metal-dependent hydrolase